MIIAPLVTVVTPSFNTGRFLEATILSVLDQDYPRVDYMIADAGSTDETHLIAERYRERVRFVSSPDNGQADAVNRSLRSAAGDIFAFLNADDIYLSGAISAAVAAFQAFPQAAVVYGEANWITASGDLIGPYPVEQYDFDRFARECFVCQPAAFIRADVFREVGGLNVDLNFAMDYDLWIRIGRRYPFAKIPLPLACSRMHLANKTLGQQPACLRENMEVVRRHFGYVPLAMVYGYCHALIHRRDLFFDPPPPSRLASLLSIPVSFCLNWRNPTLLARELLELASKKTG